ncbi:hypothetical protein [Terriglobus roseus]|nr:hypothetical protein [Terriglobus roseus]
MTQSSSGGLRRFSRAEVVFVTAIVMLYVLLFDHFRTFQVDDPWFASFSYNYWNDGIVTDTLYKRHFPRGMGGVEAFGKLAACVQAPLMNALGWSLRGLAALSTCFVAASLALLADVCRRLRHSVHFTLCVIAVAGLTEPFVVVSQGTRFEFLALFLLIAALWCAVRGWVFSAALIACVSVEIEPAAIVVVLGVFTALLMMPGTRYARLRRLPWMALAAGLAVAVYFALHPHAVSTFYHADWSSVDASAGTHGFVFQYLFLYKRHWPEMIALITATVISVRTRQHLLKEWPAVAIAVTVVASVVLKWGNPRYFVLIMPFFALFVTGAFFTERRWKLIVLAVLAIMLPQYAYRYSISIRQAPALTSADQREIGWAIDRTARSEGLRIADASVLGNSNVWFAHPGHFVALDRRVLQTGRTVSGDVIVCFENKLDPTLREMGSELKCSELRGLPNPVERITVHGYPLQVIAATGKPITAPLPDWLLRRLKTRDALQ